MDDKCVVCGEADEGKPLYKKLGSGEYNVEVIVALRDLELTSLPESAKADHYICWDCDETILQEYGRFLEYEEKRKVQEEKAKEEKRMKKNEQQRKRRALGTIKPSKPKEVVKPVPEDISKFYPPKVKTFGTPVPKGSCCCICDCRFEIATRGYYRFTLKKMVTDDMDVASVMEFLGLARHIAPEVRGKRYICNTCFYTIRRNYKTKVAKGSSVESPVEGRVKVVKKPTIHRATPDEHAAEIAKLLPPALAECYKIMTSDTVCNPSINVDTRANSDGRLIEAANRVDGEVEEEEGVKISQDEHGNYLVDMKLESPSKHNKEKNVHKVGHGRRVMETPPHRKKKNVLLPKRHHHHLLEGDSEPSNKDGGSMLNKKSLLNVSAEGKVGSDPGEITNSRTCNICGRIFSGKSDDWWHTLSSSLSGLESVTVSMALQMLETSLANTNEKARLACQVCNLCFGMVSSGFRRQVVQRIAHQKNIDASQVNFSKIKVRMMRKEDLCGVETSGVNRNGLKTDQMRPDGNNFGVVNIQESNDMPQSLGNHFSSNSFVDGFPDSHNHLQNHKALSGDHAMRTKRKKSRKQSVQKEILLTSGNSVEGIDYKTKEDFVVNSGRSYFETDMTKVPVVNKKPEYYNVNRNCHLYFPLSKMKEAKVVVCDIRNSLPKEAFDGRVLLVHDQPDGGYQVTFPSGDIPSSAFQVLLNSMLPPNWTKCPKIKENKDKKASEMIVSGRCVVCAYFFHRPLLMWHNLREDIKPPSLQVPVRWVLASLNIAPVKLTAREKEEGRVCEGCFLSLTKQFEEFVRAKIGESCSLNPSQVVVTDYVVTFNQETMNIEADPVDLLPEEELEESSRIVNRVESMIRGVNFDSLLDESYINPLNKDEFTTCLLLALNEFRMQIGADSTKLVSWLIRLMPAEYHIKRLQPVESRVLLFVDSVAAILDGSSRECFDKLNSILPMTLFACPKSQKSTKKTGETPEIKTEIKEEVSDYASLQYEKEVNWEDFLSHVNIDHLFEGKGKPLPRKFFNNGLLYGLWRVANDLNVGEEVLASWLQQLSPIPLEISHVKLLLNAPKPIHDHLMQHPEDAKKLDCIIIPEPPSENEEEGLSKDVSSKRKAKCSPKEKLTNKRPKYHSATPSSTSLSSPNENDSCSGDIKKTLASEKLESNVETPRKDKGESQTSESPTNVDIGVSESPSNESTRGLVTKDASSINQKLASTEDKDMTESEIDQVSTEESQENNYNESHLANECHSLIQQQEDGGNEVTNSSSEGEPVEISSKIKGLEDQPQAVERENHELLELNQKSESEETKEEDEKVEEHKNIEVSPCKDLDWKLKSAGSKDDNNKMEHKKTENISPFKENAKKSANQSKLQRESADNKPNQTISSTDNTPKNKELCVKNKKRLSLNKDLPKPLKGISKELQSDIHSTNKVDQKYMKEVDTVETESNTTSLVQNSSVESDMPTSGKDGSGEDCLLEEGESGIDEKSTKECQGFTKNILSNKENKNSFKDISDIKGPDVAQVSVKETLISECSQSQNTVASDSISISDSKITHEESEDKDDGANKCEIVEKSEWTKEKELKNSTPMGVMNESGTDSNIKERKSISLGIEKSFEGTEFESKTEETSGVLNSLDKCSENNESDTDSVHSRFEECIESDKSKLCDSNKPCDESGTTSSLIKDSNDHKLESSSFIPKQKDTQEADSAITSSPEVSEEKNGEKVLENHKDTGSEDVPRKDDNDVSTEKESKDMNIDLEKTQLSLTEMKDMDNSICTDGEKSSNDPVVTKRSPADFTVLNEKKGEDVPLENNKKSKCNLSDTEKDVNNKESFNKKATDSEVLNLECETEDEGSETHRKLKIKRNSEGKHSSIGKRESLVSDLKRKNSESEMVEIGNDAKKSKVSVLPQGHSKGSTPGKVASSKKPKPRFEDLMTYDT